MSIKLGTTDINKIELGTTDINKIFLGNTIIFGEVLPFDGNTSLASNIVGYWKSDDNGTFPDATPNANSGTISGATFTASGIINGAYSFDGINDEISIADDPVLDFGTGDFSVSFWINKTAHNAAGGILSKRDTSVGTAPGWQLFEGGTGNQGITVRMKDGDVGQADITFNLGLTLGTFFHIMFTFDRSGNVTCYKDGSSFGTGSISGATSSIDNAMPFLIGRLNVQSFFTNSVIDEVALWNDLKDATDASDLYNGGSGLQY